MGKKQEPKPLPPTNVETAEKRLEEIINNKSIIEYEVIFENNTYYSCFPYEGESRLFPDGFEAVTSEQEGRLHVERRRLFVRYNLEKDYAKQIIKTMEGK